ncbi:hypothetical protein [Chitinivorax sp. B]|uniref:hypothetical protein n=1 Tax=Chitinivorax sp. B TaxID=2502235 RepID=UPI001484E4A8|nr:hypothetical protein [Chitinivorax sp. B]
MNAETHAVTGIATFEVKFDAGSSVPSKRIYANGRMQTRVLVMIRGKDGQGNEVPLDATTLSKIKLIRYNGGDDLQGGWSASKTENSYEHEFPSLVFSDNDLQEFGAKQADFDIETVHEQLEVERGGVNPAGHATAQIEPQRVDFWVTTSSTGTLQIAAAVTLPGGAVVKTNNTGTPGMTFNSSVTVEGKTPESYSIEAFKFDEVLKQGNTDTEYRTYNYYIGLFPAGRQLKLVKWFHANGGTGDGQYWFYGSGKVDHWHTIALNGWLNQTGRSKWEVTTSSGRYLSVPINDRSGQITVTQFINRKNWYLTSVKTGNFDFSVHDLYGTEHRLRIRTVISDRAFILEKR